VLGIAARAEAQSPGASESSTGPSLAQDLASAPRPGESGLEATIGGQLQTGRTETKGLAVNGIWAHTTTKHSLWRVDVETNYAWYRPTEDSPSYVAEDNQQANLIYMHPLKPRVWLLGTGGWRRDAILGLNYRVAAEAGIGVDAIATKRATLFLGTGFAAGKEDRKHTEEGSNVADVAFLQMLNIRLTGVLGFEEWFKGHIDTTNADDGNYTLNLSLTAKVSKHAGLKIYYKRQYDALHSPEDSAVQSQLGGGVQITFAAPPAAASGAK
jgi:hypothetical protein